MQKGFTIIELVISIFLLAIAVIGIFSAFSVVAILTSDASNRLTATYLAQEGMEIVRNIRDTNWLNMDAENPPGATWVDNFSVCEANGCEMDYTSGVKNFVSSLPISPWVGRYLKIDDDGFYNYSNGDQSKFMRRIIIKPVDGADYVIKVFTQVSWDEKANILNSRIPAGSSDPKDPGNLLKCNPANCIKTEMTLYNWYNYNLPEEEDGGDEEDEQNNEENEE